MDKSFFEENNTIIVSFCTKTLWYNSMRTNRTIRKFKRKGFYLSDESTYIINKNGFTSNLVFKKTNNPWGSIEQKERVLTTVITLSFLIQIYNKL